MFFPNNLNKEFKTISIFGSTGSIGENCLKIIKSNINNFQIETLSANSNVEKLIAQCLQFKPKNAIIADEQKFSILQNSLKHHNIKIFSGQKALKDLASEKCDLHIAAISGLAGLPTTISALEGGSNVAIANKESIVAAGFLLKKVAAEKRLNILPLDSEHSGVFQCLNFNHKTNLEKITLTASGGPFLNLSHKQMFNMSLDEAIRHPNWSMGIKNSIDSASMANKALEMIEAKILFDLTPQQIDMIIHPESIIHAIVSFNDGSKIMQASAPSMLAPLSFGLSWPNRIKNDYKELNLNLAEIGNLNFIKPNEQQFPFIKIARECLESESQVPSIVMNSANEYAGHLFQQGKIAFGEIANITKKSLDSLVHKFTNSTPLIEEIQAIDKEVNQHIQSFIKTNS